MKCNAVCQCISDGLEEATTTGLLYILPFSYIIYYSASEWVEFNVPINTLLVISEMKISSKSVVVVPTTKSKQKRDNAHEKHNKQMQSNWAYRNIQKKTLKTNQW